MTKIMRMKPRDQNFISFHFPILDNDYNSDDDDYNLREIRVHGSADDDVVKPVAVDVVDSHRVAKVGANL